MRIMANIHKCREIWLRKEADTKFLRAISRAPRRPLDDIDFYIGQTVFFYHWNRRTKQYSGWKGPAIITGRAYDQATISYNTSSYNISTRFLKSSASVHFDYGAVEGLQLYGEGGETKLGNVPGAETLRWIQRRYHERKNRKYKGPAALSGDKNPPAHIKQPHLLTVQKLPP